MIKIQVDKENRGTFFMLIRMGMRHHNMSKYLEVEKASI